jgi:hypothetical protein
MICTGEALFDCADENPCTDDRAACTEEVCACESTVSENGSPCVVDANACTEGDTCQEGSCVQGEAADVEDGNPCTAGVCVKGEIEQKPLEGPCSDGDPCTVGDTCTLAQCVPDALKDCPELSCAEAGWCDSDAGDCVYDFKADGTACEYGSPCGGSGVCTVGQCELAENPCNDLNPCTADICAEDGECQNLPLENGTLCENPEICAVSTCKAGLCQATPGAGCDDGNPCTVDECVDGGSCVSTPAADGTPCDEDDDVCDGEDACQSGKCEVGEPLVCTDPDPCLDASCHPQIGCLSTPVPGCGEEPACEGFVGVLDGSSCIMVPDALSDMPTEFTVEFWIRPASSQTGPSLFDKIVDGDWSIPGWRIQNNANGPPYANSIHYQEINQSGGMNGQVTKKDTVPVGVWTHFAVSRWASDTWSLFINGQKVGSGGGLGAGWVANQSNPEPLWIGCTDFEKAFFPGAFDEIRISRVARYSSNFDPPTAPLETDGDTILLYHFDSGEGGQIIDSSGLGNHGTVFGTPGWEAGGPVAEISCDDGDPCTADACESGECNHTPIPGCGDEPDCPSFAAVFDGASCIEVPEVLNPMPESFTIEMWFYGESEDLYQRVLDKVVDGDWMQPGFQLSYNDFPPFPNNLHYQEVKTDGNFHGVMTGDQSVPTGAWIHYALVRSETGLTRRFLNGQSLGASPFNGATFMVDQSNDTPLWIGCEDFESLFFQGRMDELRISAGERYTSSFETKDVGFVTDADTLALYHFDEAGGEEVIDASGNGHHGLFHGNPKWLQESPVWTDDCEPGDDNEGPFELGKTILDEPLETLSGTIPPGATSMTVSVWGAGGSGGYPGHGGGGAFLKASFPLENGDEVKLVVAEGGKTNGGGGGASLVSLKGEIVLVVGGGGGAGHDGCSGCSGVAPAGSGGGGGAYGGIGMPGLGVSYVNIIASGGQGGAQVLGGAGGAVADGSDYDQQICTGGDGSALTGGASTQGTFDNECSGAQQALTSAGGSAFTNGGGGGGGSGVFGGGGGGGKWTYVGGGGGGGSSWAHAQASVITSATGGVVLAGGAEDPDYAGQAGEGGAAGDNSGWPEVVITPSLGQAGRIVVVFQ